MRFVAIAVLTVALAVAGCGSATPSSPMPAPSPSASAPSTARPSPSPLASAPEPSAVPTASPSPCPSVVMSRELASESLIGVDVKSGGPAGTVTFTFGPPDPAWPAGPPSVQVASATPPFTAGASDLPLDVPGSRHVRLRFADMKVADDAGAPTYDGPTSLDPGAGPIQAVVEEQAFEGIVSWLIGYEGDGCVTVDTSADGLALLVRIGQ